MSNAPQRAGKSSRISSLAAPRGTLRDRGAAPNRRDIKARIRPTCLYQTRPVSYGRGKGKDDPNDFYGSVSTMQSRAGARGAGMKWTIFDTLAAIVVGAIAGVLVGYVLMVVGAFLLYEVAR